MSERLSDLEGEDDLVRRLAGLMPVDPERVVAGPGDDCAVLRTPDPGRYELFKTDCVVEGIHFSPGTDPGAVGWKAMARNVSDFAAMGGGEPVAALVTIAVEPERSLGEVEGWYRGMRRVAERYGFSVAGGETASIPSGSAAMISVAMIGEIGRDRCLFRSGARVGDFIAVTGKLGGSLASGRHLAFEPRMEIARRIAARGGVTALMDISDGLARDLPRLASASGVGYSIEPDRVPRNEGCDLEAALADGEDFELLATFSEQPDDPDFTVIGRITETVETPLEGGWDHLG